jgi:hypothetical protein
MKDSGRFAAGCRSSYPHMQLNPVRERLDQPWIDAGVYDDAHAG